MRLVDKDLIVNIPTVQGLFEIVLTKDLRLQVNIQVCDEQRLIFVVHLYWNRAAEMFDFS